MAILLTTAACSGSDPSDVGAVPGRPTTTLVPTSTTTTRPATAVSPTTATTAASRPSTTQALEPAWTRYTSATYKVSLAYPPTWSEPTESASAPDYFSLGAASVAEQPFGETCRTAAAHQLRPFGSRPMIRTDLTFGGQPACIIEPSPDQPAANRGMAQLMVRYPTPLQRGNDAYEVLVVTAHNRFVPAIASTLSFA